MERDRRDTAYYSGVCVRSCGGLCCDPWWGIIAYPVVKRAGLSNLTAFRNELIDGIKAREERIRGAYVTSEEPRRRLFGAPDKYNVMVKSIKSDGSALVMDLIAMYAFRCLFLSDEKTCAIHPAVLGGKDIRPPHCGRLGSSAAGPQDKGYYCRIIDAAGSPDETVAMEVEKAIGLERATSARHHGAGVDSIEEAADKVIAQLKDYCSRSAPRMLSEEKRSGPGRNDPCWCGSNLKFKKCHGR